jgi:hypothetical protein
MTSGDASGVNSPETYVVDSNAWTQTDVATACRLILLTLQGSVGQYETDIPITRADWPPDVAAAAEVLRDVAARNGRIERGGYAQTGVVDGTRDEVWSAFVTFAPWSYDATAWGGTTHSQPGWETPDSYPKNVDGGERERNR